MSKCCASHQAELAGRHDSHSPPANHLLPGHPVRDSQEKVFPISIRHARAYGDEAPSHQWWNCSPHVDMASSPHRQQPLPHTRPYFPEAPRRADGQAVTYQQHNVTTAASSESYPPKAFHMAPAERNSTAFGVQSGR